MLRKFCSTPFFHSADPSFTVTVDIFSLQRYDKCRKRGDPNGTFIFRTDNRIFVPGAMTAPSRVALVTGASRGIGLATARLLGENGWRVALGCRQNLALAEAAAAALREEGYDAFAVMADVADRDAVDRMCSAVESRLGPIGLLVNNAGFAQQKMFCDITPEEWDRMFAVTVTGAFHCCQRVLPGMLRRGGGTIVNISSMWGQTGASCEVHYSAAKAALIGMTKALAKELGPSDITVNCVAPGVIDTDMCASFSEETRAALADETPLGRLGTPLDVARTILFLAGEGGDFLTGQVLAPNGGFVI